MASATAHPQPSITQIPPDDFPGQIHLAADAGPDLSSRPHQSQPHQSEHIYEYKTEILNSFEAKHSRGALTRIFIGPHRLGGSAKGKGKEKEVLLNDDDDESNQAGEGEQERVRKREKVKSLAKKRPKIMRMTSGESIISRKGRSTIYKWTGATYEIGGDLRKEEEDRKRLEGMAKRGNDAISKKVIPTVRTTPVLELTPENYTLNNPPMAIENSVPELTHLLSRRQSDAPLASSSHSLYSPATTPLLVTQDLLPVPSQSSLVRGGSETGLKISPNPSAENGSSFVQRARSVNFVETPSTPALSTPKSGDSPPVPAEEVLSRPDDMAGMRKKDKVAQLKQRKRDRQNKILLQERMIVKVGWTIREDLPEMNDINVRKFPIQASAFEEYAVVWKPGRIELWSEYAFEATSFFTGHKLLKHIIPLDKARTNLSLYSSPDTIFCLTHRGGSDQGRQSSDENSPSRFLSPSKSNSKKKKQEGGFHPYRDRYRREGTSVFVFRPRNILTANEWIWKLHLDLGKAIPTTLEIGVPALGAKLRLPIPEDFSTSQDLSKDVEQGFEYPGPSNGIGEGWKALNSKKVIDICATQLATVAEWKDVLAGAQEGGAELKLVWRRGENLFWIPEGKEEKDFSLISGWIMRQPNLETTLELRLGTHGPTTVRIPADLAGPLCKLSEPPAIEGYVSRVKPNGTGEKIYLSTHDGHLFLCRPSDCCPPPPPFSKDHVDLKGKFSPKKNSEDRRPSVTFWDTLIGIGKSGNDEAHLVPSSDEEYFGVLEELEAEEKTRCLKQIRSSRGYIDLTGIVTLEVLECADDYEVPDIGGEAGLQVSTNRDLTKKRRTLVLTLKNGRVIMFECHSISIALEWVGRLSSLTNYWTRREKADVEEQMEMQSSDQHIERSRSPDRSPSPERDFDAISPLLSRVYNRCIIEGCRNIVYSGRFYVKKGLRAIFQERYLFLLPGVILEYNVKERDWQGVPTSHLYHQRQSTISLRDCYVYSGELVESDLGPGTSGTTLDPASGGQAKFARIYSGTDGLRTSDSDGDCCLVIFKKTGDRTRLGRRGKTFVLKARSKIERDEWLFALNTSISQLQQVEVARETRLKSFPWL